MFHNNILNNLKYHANNIMHISEITFNISSKTFCITFVLIIVHYLRLGSFLAIFHSEGSSGIWKGHFTMVTGNGWYLLTPCLTFKEWMV